MLNFNRIVWSLLFQSCIYIQCSFFDYNGNKYTHTLYLILTYNGIDAGGGIPGSNTSTKEKQKLLLNKQVSIGKWRIYRRQEVSRSTRSLEAKKTLFNFIIKSNQINNSGIMQECQNLKKDKQLFLAVFLYTVVIFSRIPPLPKKKRKNAILNENFTF